MLQPKGTMGLHKSFLGGILESSKYQIHRTTIKLEGKGLCQGQSKTVRPGEKKCKGDVTVKGSEDKERDRPRESGC